MVDVVNKKCQFAGGCDKDHLIINEEELKGFSVKDMQVLIW